MYYRIVVVLHEPRKQAARGASICDGLTGFRKVLLRGKRVPRSVLEFSVIGGRVLGSLCIWRITFCICLPEGAGVVKGSFWSSWMVGNEAGIVVDILCLHHC